MKNKGITMVALIITIIVLLILAGVALSALMGNNGIIDKSYKAAEKYKIEQCKEEITRAISDLRIQKVSEGSMLQLDDLKILQTTLDNFKVLEESTANELIVVYKNYKFSINEKFNIKYIGNIQNEGNTEKPTPPPVEITENNYYETRYLILEVYDTLGSNCSSINELEFFDENKQKISYTIPYVYDSVTKGVPKYWNDTVWNKTKLYDGKYAYASITVGSATTTLFNYATTPGSGAWSRLEIDFGEIKKLSKINM